MEILTGLFDHMVVQRNSRNVSDALFTGTANAAGKVLARVTRGGRVLTGYAAKAVGTARGGKFEGRLSGLPVGGPYEITLTIPGNVPETLTVSDLLVGDVWLLGGQSNMEGCGFRKDRAKPHPLVREFYMTDEWRSSPRTRFTSCGRRWTGYTTRASRAPIRSSEAWDRAWDSAKKCTALAACLRG